jgi:hypothetical protein
MMFVRDEMDHYRNIQAELEVFLVIMSLLHSKSVVQSRKNTIEFVQQAGDHICVAKSLCYFM